MTREYEVGSTEEVIVSVRRRARRWTVHVVDLRGEASR